jgi:prepilin-type N-terminal cleavage/methylation domain-containing protein/prepilin-type processing-associated H-X9-DG protein
MSANKTNEPRRLLCGFTLIELLVTIAIIAILAGLLFPTIAASRQKAQSVKCMAQLKQWGQAFNGYLSENNGVYPSGGGSGTINVNDPAAWFNAVAKFAGEIPLMDRVATKQPKPGDKSLFSCPSASQSELPGKPVFLSYALNDQVFVTGRTTGNIGVPALRQSHLAKPSTFPLLFDAAVDSGQGGSDKLKLRHIKSTGNILFADGRVQTVTNSAAYNNVTINWDPSAAL